MDPLFSPSRRRTRRSKMTIQHEQQLKNNEEVSFDVSPCKSTSLKNDTSNIISTPKAKRFQIPEINTCPPAPKKKRRILFSSSTTCNKNSLKRSHLSCFTPLDLEIFFNFAH